mgnify:CR=1 FL=1
MTDTYRFAAVASLTREEFAAGAIDACQAEQRLIDEGWCLEAIDAFLGLTEAKPQVSAPPHVSALRSHMVVNGPPVGAGAKNG